MATSAYLDNATTTFPKPSRVHEAVARFYRECGVSPGRSGYDLGIGVEELVHRTRQRLSGLFNQSLSRAGTTKDPNRLVFTANGTMGLNLVINGTLGRGDHVVTTKMEHNSVIRPVNHRALDGVEATFVAPDSEGTIDPEDIRKAIRGNTKLVLVNHASNVTGAVQDLEAIGRVCGEEGVPLAVDAAQSAGVLPIDMPLCNISFLVFTGHKGLLAPTGTGGICIADDAEIEGTIYGGTGVRSAHPYHLTEFPYRLEAGTPNVAGIAGLAAGLDWLEEHGQATLYREEMALLALLQEGLSEIGGVQIHGTSRLEMRIPVVSITLDNWDPADVGTFLDVDHDVQTRTGLQCAPLVHEVMGTSPRGTVRFSLGPFNTREHIETAVRAVGAIAAARR